jgi:hypothetical protein
MFEVGVAHLAEDPADPSAARDDCPPAVGHAVLRALEKDPGERPGTATDFATSLQNAAR